MPKPCLRQCLVVVFFLIFTSVGGAAADADLPFLAPPPGAAACDGPAQAPTGSEESIQCFKPHPNTEVWTISRPNVRQSETTYDNIRFRQGDLVHVMAGGCVQTGGSGFTWKRYVNPMDRVRGDDDRYFGLVQVPGVFAKGRIREAMRSSPLAVLQDPGADAALRLGYSDDGYGDNGYWGPDWGWFEQCRDMGDAFVVIAIQHDCASAPDSADCSRAAPLDLTSERLDENGFPENPRWGWQRVVGTRTPAWQLCGLNKKSGGMPEDDLGLCTRQLIEKDTYWACARDFTWGRIEGHANYADSPVTYRGTLSWDDHGGGDDDYTLNISRDDRALFSFDHHPQLEFDSDETIDGFTSTWWAGFHDLVDQEDSQKASLGPVVHFAGKAFGPEQKADAIVIGQLGLDCVHACDPEIHPVWGIAIHVKPDLHDDVWAFFVRNWGNEGFCGRSDHRPGDVRSLTFRFEQPGSTDVRFRPETEIGANFAMSPATLAMVPGGGAALATFVLPEASQHGIIHGDLHLDWTSGVPVRALTELIDPDADLSAAVRAGREWMGENRSSEGAAASQWVGLGKTRRARFEAATAGEPRRLLRGRIERVREARIARARVLKVVQVDDPKLDERRRMRLKLLEELSQPCD
jgi:hypothetical protein